MSKMSNLHARLTEDGMIPDGPDDSDWDAPIQGDGTMTIRDALSHAWEPDGIDAAMARTLIRQGGWANGSPLDPERELPALRALADGAGPDDDFEPTA
jgi:hypothetical protein